MRIVYLVSVWLHILAATVWIGGMAFLVLVVVPTVRKPEFRAMAAPIIRSSGRRFRVVGWICLATLVVSGLMNVAGRGIPLASMLDGAWGTTLGVKLVIVGIILAMSALHDFVLGPRASQLLMADPVDPRAHRARRMSSWFGRITLLLSIAAVALGVLLVRGLP